MPGNFRKKDLRVMKTRKVLFDAMSNLLDLRNFNQITVNDLCEEALVSRTTFYSHFIDKYDLLKCWLGGIEFCKKNTYEEMEEEINDFVSKNKKKIKNLFDNIDNETSELLCDFFFSLLCKEDKSELVSLKDIVLSNICCGAIFYYLSWQVKNAFPTELPVMNPYVYGCIKDMKKWGN